MMPYSVLMSVYYKETPEYFETAIESMLTQTLPPDEFVIVCDGKLPEELDQVIDKYQTLCGNNLFKILRLEENQGLGSALQAGLLVCKNDLVARMDSDDISVTDRLKWQIETIENHPEISVVGGQILEFVSSVENVKKKRIVPLTPEKINKKLPFRNPLNHVTAVFRKKDILSVGGYQKVIGYEDYDLWMRLIAAGYQCMNIDKVCCYVRIGDEMYGRRCGLAYFRNAAVFEKRMLSAGMQTSIQYCLNIVLRFVGTVLIPRKILRIFYNVFLRS